MTNIEGVLGTPFDDAIKAHGDGSAHFVTDYRLYGNDGNDTLQTDAGNDVLDGGPGNDLLEFGSGQDTVFGGPGNDQIYSFDGLSDTVGDTLDGGPGDDYVNSDAGKSADFVYGDAGNDTLVFGDGDIVSGGEGADAFYFYPGNFDSTTPEHATITDLSPGEQLSWQFQTAVISPDGFSSSWFVGPIKNGDGSTTGLDQVEFSTASGATTLYFGYDSNPGADFVLSIAGTYSIDQFQVDTSDGFQILIRVQGGSGDDTLVGGAPGNDVYDGGAGVDTLDYSTTTQGITVDLSAPSNQATGPEIGTDQLTNIENVTGGSGGDNIKGNAADNVLNGGGGADTLHGGLGDDTLTGGSGNDWLYGDGGNDMLTGGDGKDVLLDRFDGFGAVTMAGGTGDDIYYVANILDVLTENASEGLDSVVSSVDGWHLGANFENLWLTHGATVGYGNDGNNVIMANPTLGSTLHGGLGDDKLMGGSGNDTLYGDGGNDTLTGNAGNDVLLDRYDGFGTVTMIGGAGNDIYYVANIHDVLTEKPNEGLDSVVSGVDSWHLDANFENLWLTHGAIVGYGNDGNNVMLANPTLGSTLHGGLGDDRLVGGSGNDALYGDGGNDTLTGNAGNDVLLDRFDGFGTVTMSGGAGNDIYYVDNIHDVLTEKPNEGLDSVVSGVDSWHLDANFENLWLTHGATLGYGNDGNNVMLANPTLGSSLYGMAGDDRLLGNNGNDVLFGGLGNDALTGGSGQDTFVFDTALNAATNVDTITDFTPGTDRVWLDHTVFAALATGTLAADELAIGTSAQDANDHIVYNNATGALFYDTDGNGAAAAIQFATLATGLALTHSDFLVV